MSYTKKLTTFTKGNQLSNCGEYNLQDLSDMFNQTEIDGAEEYTELEDILNEENTNNDPRSRILSAWRRCCTSR